jgi:dipeptidyl aminopeptidase/acylaminoacyl peptidase
LQSGNTDIWLFDLARGVPTRFTVEPGANTNPIWSPDGSRIAFVSTRGGVQGIYQKPSNLGGGETLLYKAAGDLPVNAPSSWSHDGRFILYGTGGVGVWLLPVEGAGDHKPTRLLTGEFGKRAARFSPDDRFFSFISRKAGRDDVYVRTFDPSGLVGQPGGGEWTVSKDGGDGAHWRADGKELFYMAPDRTIMAVEVTTTPTFQPRVPKPLFKTNAATPYWEVSPNGQQFLIPVQVGATSAAPYTVVLNWQAALKK